MSRSTLVLAGDSLTQGTGPTGTACTYGQGGSGSWAERVTDWLANLSGVGPLLSSGMRPVWLGLIGSNNSEWTFAGSWTNVASTDAFDKAPYDGEPSIIHGIRYGNGQAVTATWTKPARWSRSIVGFALYWIDKTGGGRWQYRIDGGTWTQIPDVPVHDNTLNKFQINSAVTSTVDVRCYDGSGAVDCLPVGIEVIYSTATDGLIVHNIACTATQLNQLCASTSGDRLAFFDSVKLGSGSPVSPAPNVGVVVMHINDVTLANTTTWANDLTTLYNRVHTLGPVGIISPWEAKPASYNTTDQASYRSQTKTTAASLGAKTMDLYDAWSGNGWTANAAAVTAGLLADQTHESQAGHIDLTPRIYWFIRNQILGLGSYPTSYPVGAKQATVAYAGKKASVAYAAGQLIAIA